MRSWTMFPSYLGLRSTQLGRIPRGYWDHKVLSGTHLGRNWDATGTLMLVMILRLTVIAVVFNIVKILPEALRKTVNDMRALVLRSSLDIESNTPTLA